MFLLNYTFLRPSTELLQERSSPGGNNTKTWDKKILGLLGLNTILTYVVAGLDSGRYNWSGEFPWQAYFIGIVLTVVGQLLFLIAQKQNKYFSSVVRIQEDRNHQVHSTGLYKLVRHPGYLGILVQSIGFPFIFGSLWSIIPTTFAVIVIFVRTYLEDSSLMQELDGYKQFTKETKFRLIPFIF